MANRERDGVRRRLLATVHVASKQLGMEKDDYRDLLKRLTGQSSAGDCSHAELHRVIAEMERLGFRGKGRPGRRPNAASHPIAKKARALWIGLHALGALEDASERALEAFGKRQLGIDRLHWADQSQASALIEALKAWAEREGWMQAVPAKLSSAERGRLLCERLIGVIVMRLAEHGGPVRPIAPAALSDTALHDAIAELGAQLREAKAER